MECLKVLIFYCHLPQNSSCMLIAVIGILLFFLVFRMFISWLRILFRVQGTKFLPWNQHLFKSPTWVSLVPLVLITLITWLRMRYNIKTCLFFLFLQAFKFLVFLYFVKLSHGSLFRLLVSLIFIQRSSSIFPIVILLMIISRYGSYSMTNHMLCC